MITHRRTILAFAAGLALLALAACTFPGAGVSVSFTSHQDHESVYGSRSVTVAGKVTGATPDAFALTLDGTDVPSATLSGGIFSAPVTLADGENVLVASARAAGFTYTATLRLTYPFLALSDGQAADAVMGARNFTTAPTARQTDIDLLYRPVGAPALVGDHLYIPDSGNNRVVGYTSLPSAPTGANFDILLGKNAADWTNGTLDAVSATTFAAPARVTAAGSRLVVADTANNRVLLFAGAPTFNSAGASVVVGQAGMATNGDTRCVGDRLEAPGAVFVADGKLIVVDTGHNRVLVWNAVPTTNPVGDADLVLGQANLTSCAANRGATAPTAATLDHPGDAWSDGTRLVVADSGNDRVLIWNAFPTAADKAADRVIGSTALTTVGSGSDDRYGLIDPASVSSNGNQIFVADTGHHRVLVWDGFPTTSGAPAGRVLGQADLTSVDANRGDPNAARNTLSGPQGVRAFDGFLIVADTGNSRELLYRPATP